MIDVFDILNKSSNINSVVKSEANLPALSIFGQGVSWRHMLESYYISQQFKLKKSGSSIYGIESLYLRFSNQNLFITSPAGYGKTTALKYLFLKYGNSENSRVYFIPASAFVLSRNKLSHYQKAIRTAVEKNIAIGGLILIDGLEEAFACNYIEASNLIQKAGMSNNNIWVACRNEYLAHLKESTNSCYEDIAEIQSWSKDDFYTFVDTFAKNVNNADLLQDVKKLISQSVIDQSSIYRPLFATMFVFIALENQNRDLRIKNEYELIDTLVSLWIKRENSEITEQQEQYYYDFLSDLALQVYDHKRPELTTDDPVIRELLIIDSRSKTFVRSFYHREFCVYFIVKGMLNASLIGAASVVDWFSRTYYDDVTNLGKVAFTSFTNDSLLSIHQNLFQTYQCSYYFQNEPQDDTSHKISALSSLELLKLRDEILYFIMKIPGIPCDDFFEFAYAHKGDEVLLSLGLAYGMATIKQHPHTLDFAKKLIPNSKESKINRSWAVCFFGDVDKDGYVYEDTGDCPWDEVREAKLKRIKKNTPSAYRFRLLDIPLLYCFYESRHFVDCNSSNDWEILNNCDVAYGRYSDEERDFILEQKQLLVSEYRKYLFTGKMAKETPITNMLDLHKEDTVMPTKAPKVFISYSWDSDEHKKWVRELSDKLEAEGITTILDQKDLLLGDHMTVFMERSISESNHVLFVCTPRYKEKAGKREGGVGYEENIITGEVLEMRNHRKFIPVLASGTWKESLPTWAIGKLGSDLSSADKYQEEFERLVYVLK